MPAVAKDKLDPTDPIRLGLALNYSVCFYEILKDKKKACDLAKSAFDQVTEEHIPASLLLHSAHDSLMCLLS